MAEKRKSPIGNPLPASKAPRRMVLIHWKDAVSFSDYQNEEDAWPYLPVWEIGFVLRDDADGLVIGTAQADDDTDERLRHCHAIPRDYIINVWDLPDPRESEGGG